MTSKYYKRTAFGLAAWALTFAVVVPFTLRAEAADGVITGVELKVKGRLTSGQNKKECKGLACEVKKDKDVSGGICFDADRCFVASDETRFVQEISLLDGRIVAGRRLYLLETDERAERHKEPDELDLEALARYRDGVIAVASHSNKRKECTPQASRHNLFYFKPKFDDSKPRQPVASQATNLDDVIKGVPELAEHLNKPLQDNGLNIEGAAVLGSRLYIGFRAPVSPKDPRRGFVLSLDANEITRGVAAKPKLHTLRFPKEGTGIRAMEPFAGGLFLLTGASGAAASNDPNCNKPSDHLKNAPALYFWNTTSTEPKFIGIVGLPEKKKRKDEFKPEGLLLVPGQPVNAPTVKLIVFYDGPKEGRPHLIEIASEALR